MRGEAKRGWAIGFTRVMDKAQGAEQEAMMTISKRVRVGQFGLAAATLLLAGMTAEPARALEEVVVGLPTNITVGQSNVVAAMELGYFEAAGLKVKLQDFQGAAIVIPQVSTKSIMIGSGGGDPLVVANQPGKTRVPVKFFYNASRDYIWEFVVPADSPVNSLKDLKGKKIGVGSLSNSHVPVTRLIMKENGLEITKDYQLMAISIGGPAFRALLGGQVDAYNTWTANIAGFESSGTKLKRLPIDPRFKGLFTVGYFAHEDTIKQKPDVLAGFGKAVSMGTLACREAIEWCVKTFWKYYPNLKPREGTDEEIIKRQSYAVLEGMKTMFAFPAGKPKRWGEYPEGAWKSFINILHEGGEIASAATDPNLFFTNELVDKMSAFDEAQVLAKAKSLN